MLINPDYTHHAARGGFERNRLVSSSELCPDQLTAISILHTGRFPIPFLARKARKNSPISGVGFHIGYLWVVRENGVEQSRALLNTEVVILQPIIVGFRISASNADVFHAVPPRLSPNYLVGYRSLFWNPSRSKRSGLALIAVVTLAIFQSLLDVICLVRASLYRVQAVW